MCEDTRVTDWVIIFVHCLLATIRRKGVSPRRTPRFAADRRFAALGGIFRPAPRAGSLFHVRTIGWMTYVTRFGFHDQWPRLAPAFAPARARQRKCPG